MKTEDDLLKLEGEEVYIKAIIKDSFVDFDGHTLAILLLNTDAHLPTKKPEQSGIYISQAGQVCIDSKYIYELGDLVE